MKLGYRNLILKRDHDALLWRDFVMSTADSWEAPSARGIRLRGTMTVAPWVSRMQTLAYTSVAKAQGHAGHPSLISL